MATKSFSLLLLLFCGLFTTQIHAQKIDTLLDKSQDILEEGRVFSIKGLGMAFPMGKINDVLNPRFSSEIGLQIMMKNRRYFIYPAIDYMNFRYDQQVDDPDFAYRTNNASAKMYIATVSAGLVRQTGLFRIFSSAGIGGGLINEPRASVDLANSEINFRNKSSFTGTMRLNTGVDYGKRTFKVFAEISYLLNTTKIQDRNLHTLAINVGTRTNLFRLAKSIGQIKKKL